MDKELQLLDAVADPIEWHVHGCGRTLFDGVIGYSIGTFVVHLDGCWRLRMSEFLSILEESSKFGVL
jgi:hypothetical protein